MKDLPILPRDVHGGGWSDLPATDRNAFAGSEGIMAVFAKSARALLDRLLSQFDLNREDQISILTTSDDVYVSTCVSVTAFNHAGISRVVTDRTRVVILIHEFGYIYPGLGALCDELRARGIIVIEDCAHVYGAIVGPGRTVGSYGDYALFSLPKIFPLQAGGLLRANSRHADTVLTALVAEDPSIEAPDMEEQFREVAPLWGALNRMRLRRHAIIREIVGPSAIRDAAPGDVPWMVCLHGVTLSERLKTRVELGATLRNDLYLIPTNPLVAEDVFRDVAHVIVAEAGCRDDEGGGGHA